MKQGIPIEEVELDEQGNWQHSLIFSAVHTVSKWSMRPSQFGICRPEEDLAYMIAHDNVFSKMELVEQEQAKREAEKKSKAARSKQKQ